MNKLILSIIASISLTGCYTTQQAYQPQPNVVYVQQPQEMPTSRLARETFKNVNYNSYQPQTFPQRYDVRDINTGEVKRYSITPR